MHVAMPAFQADWDTLMSSKVIGGRIGGNQPDRAFLGVFTEDNEKGALVLEVREDSPAAKAGIQKDDIIKKVDGTEIKGAEALTMRFVK